MTRRSRPSGLARCRCPGVGPPGPPGPGPPPQVRLVFTGALGGWKSHVSGMPTLPSDPRETPFKVNEVLPEFPVRTSTEVVPVKTTVSPLWYVLPACDVPDARLPSTQTL